MNACWPSAASTNAACADGAVAIANWNVGDVPDMNNLFYGKSGFNADLSLWNTQSVTRHG